LEYRSSVLGDVGEGGVDGKKIHALERGKTPAFYSLHKKKSRLPLSRFLNKLRHELDFAACVLSFAQTLSESQNG